MTKNKDYPTNDEDNIEEDLEIEKKDEAFNEEKKEENEDREPLFPFTKMPYQEKGENENDIHEYEMGSDQELDLGESEKRTKRRTLGEERGAGHEP